MFGLAGPELHWQLPVARRLLCQEFRLAPSREVLISRELSLPREVWGCVDSLPSAPLSGPGATKRNL